MGKKAEKKRKSQQLPTTQQYLPHYGFPTGMPPSLMMPPGFAAMHGVHGLPGINMHGGLPGMTGVPMPVPGGPMPGIPMGAQRWEVPTADADEDSSSSSEECQPVKKKRKKAKRWDRGDITSSITYVGDIGDGRIAALLENIDPRYSPPVTCEIDSCSLLSMFWCAHTPIINCKADKRTQ